MKDALTTSNVAELLGVAVASVSKWIDSGSLRAGKTPGGHRRVAVSDLLKFLKSHQLPIPEELQGHTLPKVLIVAANRLQCRTLGTKLRRRLPNLLVFDAYDDVMAGAILERERPGATIIDLSADEDHGIEFCTHMKSLSVCKGMAIIVLVRADSKLAKGHSLPCCKSMILTKPVVAAKLTAAVRAAIGDKTAPAGRSADEPPLPRDLQGHEESAVSLSMT
jgi:excisionase family DNA binding protein